MELRKTEVFERDVKRLDGSLRERLKKAIRKIVESPESGKPMGHLTKVFSERVEPFRLIYCLRGNELLLVCFKNRDEAYEHLRSIASSL